MNAIALSARTKKSLRKHRKSGSFPQEKFTEALECLRMGAQLPPSFRDHALRGALLDFREFHLAQDLLVQYRIYPEEKVVSIFKIGTHAELLGA